MRILVEARDAIHWKAKDRHAAVVRRAIDVVDDFVIAHEYVAYAHDGYGVHANPDAPRHVRLAMRVLARLMRARDGRPPCWARRPGEHQGRLVGA